MAKPVNIYDAKTRLSELVERASKGEEIVIAKAGRPMARLVAAYPPVTDRKPGRWKGKIWMSDDCWDPMSAEELALWEGPIEPDKR